MNPHRLPAAAAVLLLATAIGACGPRTAPPPEPGTQRGTPPDLRGRTVMILPVQQVLGVPGDIDAELVFGLRSREAEVDWVPPDALDRALDRSPSLRSRTRGLPVGQFLQAEVIRIGDPLFGELVRLSSLVDAQAALLPIQAVLVQKPEEEQPRVRLTMALVDTRSGFVAWFAIFEGDPRPADDPRLTASAADQVARNLLWYSRGGPHAAVDGLPAPPS